MASPKRVLPRLCLSSKYSLHAESTWSLSKDEEVLASGTPSAANEVEVFNWDLEDGRYCLSVSDTYYSDGGMSAALSVNGLEVWTLDGDTLNEAVEYCFTIGNDCASTVITNGKAVLNGLV